jgi:hypothetical protein
MKKHLLLLSLIALFFASPSSGGERILGTPAERLVGHWSTESGDNLYYAKIKSDGLGSYILVQPNGNIAIHRYKIISQISAGERIIVQLIFSGGNKRYATYMISKDGKELESTTEILGMKITLRLKYVDDKEKP